ncbi:hypothetical protein HK102_008275 [Quaeritorhiza haematococci]|nr:hypothetical protein HK102_008275 [Quaeritorhiza haematococci]
MNTLPPEIHTEIGAWLPDNADFANLAVALGVKWEPAAQAQRMIRKYGRDDFLSHIQLADERETEDRPYTTTQRGYLDFSGDQLRFYEYLVKHLPDVAAREVERCIKSADDYDFAWEARLQPFLKFGVKFKPSSEFFFTAIGCYPALLELLLETGQLDVTEPVKQDMWILEMWILDYGWLPRPSRHRYNHSDPSNVFCKLARYQRWAAATVLLNHFGRELDVDDARFVLSQTAHVMYPGPNDAQAQFDFVNKMVTVFPEAVESHEVNYIKTK